MSANPSDHPPFRAKPPAFRLLVCALVAVALQAATWLSLTQPLPDRRGLAGALVVLVLLLVCDLDLLWRSSGDGTTLQTLGDAFLVPLLLIGGPAVAFAGSQLTLALVQGVTHRERPLAWYDSAFNHAQVALQLTAGWAVWAALAPLAPHEHTVLRATAAVVAALAVSLALNVGANAAEGRSLDGWLRSPDFLDELGVQVAVLPCAALVTIILNQRATLAPLLVLGSITAVRYAVRQERRRRSAEARLGIDPLTQLANRQRFWERLTADAARAERSGRPLGLLLLDIDDFKRLNDTHGHLVGDDCLVAVAEALRATARRGDLPCRYGGEEFALVLADAGPAEALAAAARLRHTLRVAHPLALTASVGVACLPEHERRPHDLVNAADAALYRAKRAGKDRACVAEPLEQRRAA